jgi:hypothetical protein
MEHRDDSKVWVLSRRHLNLIPCQCLCRQSRADTQFKRGDHSMYSPLICQISNALFFMQFLQAPKINESLTWNGSSLFSSMINSNLYAFATLSQPFPMNQMTPHPPHPPCVNHSANRNRGPAHKSNPFKLIRPVENDGYNMLPKFEYRNKTILHTCK